MHPEQFSRFDYERSIITKPNSPIKVRMFNKFSDGSYQPGLLYNILEFTHEGILVQSELVWGAPWVLPYDSLKDICRLEIQ
jgi:hypothetical protein